jgi:murein DD-endopeptidase MepM/ murein hydrolase activator NlpD
MPRMPSTTRLLTAAVGLALAATPALPALAAPGAEIDGRFAVARVGGWAEDEQARQRAAARADGPFVPIVGGLDTGSAEAGFGAARSGHVHAGQDLFAPAGTPLVAVGDGVVADAGSDGGQGNYLHLYDPERKRTYVYMHMIEPTRLRAGDRVSAGEPVGGVGCTGSCWGDHLHFEIRSGRGIGAEAIDPMPALRDWESLERPR